MKTIVIANQKGGVGKTTTTFALASELMKLRYKVLVIDGDPSGNLSYLAADKENLKTLEDVLEKKTNIKDAITKSTIGGFDIISNTWKLSDADRRFTGVFDYTLVRDALFEVQGEYDYCIIDSPPNLGILSVNYLTAADYVVVPVNPCAFSLQGLTSINDVINSIKSNVNPKLKVAGILLTRVVKRARAYETSKDIAKELANVFNTIVFNTTIRQSVSVGRSQLERRELLNYGKYEGVAGDYRVFTQELIDLIGKKGE